MSGQSDNDMGTNLLPYLYEFVRFLFQINCVFFLFLGNIYANIIHRQGATDYSITIRCMDKISGKVSLSPYSPKFAVAYRELRVYFAVQIPPFIDWT